MPVSHTRVRHTTACHPDPDGPESSVGEVSVELLAGASTSNVGRELIGGPAGTVEVVPLDG